MFSSSWFDKAAFPGVPQRTPCLPRWCPSPTAWGSWMRPCLKVCSVPRTCPPASSLLSGRPATCLAWGMNESCQPPSRIMEAGGASHPLGLLTPNYLLLVLEILCPSPYKAGHRPRLRSCFCSVVLPGAAFLAPPWPRWQYSVTFHTSTSGFCAQQLLFLWEDTDDDNDITTVSPPWVQQKWGASRDKAVRGSQEPGSLLPSLRVTVVLCMWVCVCVQRMRLTRARARAHVHTHNILPQHQVVAVCWVLPAYGQKKVTSP